MKKTLLISFLFLTISQLAHAQWTNSGSNVYINSGFVGIGNTSPQNPLDIQRAGSGNTGAIVSIQGFANSGAGGYLRLVKSKGTTLGAFVTTASGDAFGTVDFMGVNTGNVIGYGARIIGYQDGPAGTNYLPGKLSFFIGSPDNTLLERMTITASGNVGIGTTTPAGGKLVVYTTGNYGGIFRGSSGGAVGVGSLLGVPFVQATTDETATTASDLTINPSGGNVGIGTTTPKETLSVNGNIRSKQIKVETANWPDYVFQKDYQLPSLQEVKTYIDQNQHLPEVPSEQEIAKDGLNVGEMNKLLMKKVEELTLYIIDIKAEIDQLKKDRKE